MSKLSPFLALALLLAGAPAFAAGAAPGAPRASCPTEPAALAPSWLVNTAACNQGFCNDDQDCRELCPDDPGATCDLGTWTCVFSPGSGSSGSCQSGSVCSPARFCQDHGDCAACDGCSGYCAADSVCRVL
jgi:hypothetical protein